MTVLTNARHERFCQELAKGNSASEAYVNAGYRDSRSAACRLSTKVNVVARLAEIQAKACQKAEVTLETIAVQLDEDRQLAHDIKQPGHAVAATMGKAKLYGLISDKFVHSGPNDGPIQHEDMNAKDVLLSRMDIAAARTGANGSTQKPH